MELLTLKNITVKYQSNIAVKDISFSVQDGDYFCLVGANGSGKSSLIKAVLGLLPLTGEVKYHISPDKVAYLPQISTIPQGLPATVMEVVKTGTQKKGGLFYSSRDVKAAKNALELLEIGSLAGKRIGELSGGQQQRVLLARALCKNPGLLILDEPFTGLDETISEGLYCILLELNRKNNVAILMVSHDLDEVGTHAKHVAVIDHVLEFCGTVEEWQEYRKAKGGHSHG